MTDLKTAIEEINSGKIYFDCKEDCCTTEGEVVIFLKRLLDLEEENNRQKAEIERLQAEVKKVKREMSYMSSPNTIGDRHEMGCW